MAVSLDTKIIILIAPFEYNIMIYLLSVSAFVPVVLSTAKDALNNYHLPKNCERDNYKLTSVNNGCGDMIAMPALGSTMVNGSFYGSETCGNFLGHLESNGVIESFCFTHSPKWNKAGLTYNSWGEPDRYIVFQKYSGHQCHLNDPSDSNYVVTTWYPNCNDCFQVAKDLFVMFECHLYPSSTSTDSASHTTTASQISSQISPPPEEPLYPKIAISDALIILPTISMVLFVAIFQLMT